MGTFITAGLLIMIVILTTRNMIINKKNGKSLHGGSCCGNCDGSCNGNCSGRSKL